MGDQPSEQDTSQQDSSVNPWPVWGTPASSLDIKALKPHNCMVDIIQRGNYIHCNIGQHGMRIPQGKQLVKDAQGNWDLIDIPLRDSQGKILAPSFVGVVL